MKLDAKQLRKTKPTAEQYIAMKRNPLYIVLDNVMDTYNIGSIFRLADAVAAEEVILCGGTETPPSSRIHKAAVGTEEWIKWRYFKETSEAISKLRSEVPDIQVVAVEQDSQAIGLSELKAGLPVAVIIGHETSGISKKVLEASDQIVEIPMWGVNKSLNVHVSASVVIYQLMKSK